MLHPAFPVHTSVYLLVLRHPVVVARRISTLALRAPGRLVLGVGIGGEDRDEVRACSVDPSTRGRRMDDCLAVLRPLLAGSTVDHAGEFFSLSSVSIRPAPPAPRSEEHTSELQSLMRNSYAVFCLKKKQYRTRT